MSRVLLLSGTRDTSLVVRDAVWYVLEHWPWNDGTYLFHGDCPTGADYWAKDWCTMRPNLFQSYGLAFPKFDGRPGGPARNSAFAEAGYALARELKIPIEYRAFPSPRSIGTQRAVAVFERLKVPGLTIPVVP